MPAAAPLVAAISSSTFLTSVAVSIGTALVMTGLQMTILAPEALKDDIAGRQELIKAPVAPHRVILGQVRVAGHLTYGESYGNNLRYMSLVVAVAGHEVEEIGTVWLDEYEVPLGADDTTPIDDSRFAGRAWFYKHLGAPDQVADPELVLQSADKWSNFHRGREVAYVHVQLRYKQKTFPTGKPTPRFLVRGAKLFDPRDGATRWSDNPALGLRFYLTQYLDFDASELDDVSFARAADICDQPVTLKDGTQEKRYTCNGTFEADEDPVKVIERILSSMAATIVWTGGRWVLHAGAAAPASMHLTIDDLRGPITVRPRLDRRELFNTVQAVFSDPRNLYQPADTPKLVSLLGIANDNNEELNRDLDLPFTTSYTGAQRLCAIALKRARQQIRVNFPMKIRGLKLQAWDTVTLTHPGFGWTAKKFRIEEWSLAEGGGVDLALREEDDSMWEYNATQEELDHDPSPDTSLPDSAVQNPPRNLVAVEDTVQDRDGKDIGRLLATWDPPLPAGFLRQYELRWRPIRTPAAAWSQEIVIPEEQTSFEVAPIRIADDFEVAVRARNDIGVESDYITDTSGVTTGDTTPPAPPATPSVAPGIQSFRVVVTAPPDPDTAKVLIYSNNTGAQPAPTAPVRGSLPLRAGQTGQWTWAPISPGVGRYFWARAEDVSGNRSAFSGRAGPSSSFNVRNPDVDNDAIDTPNMQDNSASANAGGAIAGQFTLQSFYETVASTTLNNSIGANRFVWIAFGIINNQSAFGGAMVRLRRSGVTVRNWGISVPPLSSYRVTLAYRDTSGGTGNRAFLCEAQNNGEATVRINDRVITVLEAKR